MQFSLASWLFLYVVSSAVESHQHGCGFHPPPLQEAMAKEREFQARVKSRKDSDAFFFDFLFTFLCSVFGLFCPQPELLIDTYVHVIIKSDGTGDWSQADINRMIAVGNGHLPHQIQMRLIETTYTVNDVWYEGETQTEDLDSMYQTLKRGSTDTMNIYVKNVNQFGDSYCGQANLAEYADNEGIADGVLLDSGDGFYSCNIYSNTVAHEVGKCPDATYASTSFENDP